MTSTVPTLVGQPLILDSHNQNGQHTNERAAREVFTKQDNVGPAGADEKHQGDP